MDKPVAGELWNWIGQCERLIYIGHNWSGNSYWHQFAKVDEPEKVWCEVLTNDLPMLERSARETQR
jgi:hypothetical protein